MRRAPVRACGRTSLPMEFLLEQIAERDATRDQ
jgi:hypothetical protein